MQMCDVFLKKINVCMRNCKQRLPKKLDGRHVVFGKVVKGMDVVRKIEAEGQLTGVPKAKVVIANSGQLPAPAAAGHRDL